MPKRQFSAYEYNQLNKFGFDVSALAEIVNKDIPVEYIIGKAEFKGNTFKVDESTLIPRIETEHIVDLAVELVKDLREISFCDVGTGTGAIGISFVLELTKKGAEFNAYLSDTSKPALEIAKQNVDTILTSKNLNCFTTLVDNSQIKVIQSNLFSNYPKNKKFDILFANLPYIPSSRVTKLDSSVKDFEPITALDGGEDGLKFIREFLHQAPAFIKKSSVILLEVDDTHNNTQEFNLKWNIKIVQDSNFKTRFWVVKPRYSQLNGDFLYLRK